MPAELDGLVLPQPTPSDSGVGRPLVDASPPPKTGEHRLLRAEDSRRALSLLVTIGRTVSALVSIALPLVLVRVFDQAAFGQYKQLFLIVGTAVPILTMGLPASLYYLVPRRSDQAQRLMTQSAMILAGLGIAGAAALALAGNALQRFFGTPLGLDIPWLAALVVFSVPVTLLPVVAMVDRRARLVSLLLAGFGCMNAAAMMLAAWWTRDLAVLLAAACGVMAIEAGALVAYLLWRGRSNDARPGPALLRAQFSYALPFAAAALVGLLRDRLHAFYVTSTVTAAEFAVYAVGLLQIPVIDLAMQTMGEVVVLENTAHVAAGRFREAGETFRRAGVALALMLFPVFAILEVFAPEVITILFGPAYGGAVPVLRVNLLLLPLGVLLVSPLLRATSDLGLMLFADLASLAVAILTLVPLVRAFGPAGAVGSLVAGFVTFALLGTRCNAARLRVTLATFLPWDHLAVLLIVAAGCAGLARFMVHASPAHWRLALGPLAAMALFAGIVWRTGLIPEADKAWALAFLRGTTRRG